MSYRERKEKKYSNPLTEYFPTYNPVRVFYESKNLVQLGKWHFLHHGKLVVVVGV